MKTIKKFIQAVDWRGMLFITIGVLLFSSIWGIFSGDSWLRTIMVDSIILGMFLVVILGRGFIEIWAKNDEFNY